MLPLKDRASFNLIIEENGGLLDLATIEEIRNLDLNFKPTLRLLYIQDIKAL